MNPVPLLGRARALFAAARPSPRLALDAGDYRGNLVHEESMSALRDDERITPKKPQVPSALRLPPHAVPRRCDRPTDLRQIAAWLPQRA